VPHRRGRPGAWVLCLSIIAAPLRADVEAIYVVPLSHTDIGFTAPPSEVAAKMAEATDEAIEAAGKDPDYRWCFESFWQLEQWLDRHQDPAPVVELLRASRFGLSAGYANPHSSLMSAWALDWEFRLPAEWGRQHGVTVDWAILDDVPGHPHDLPTFLARNGVRYLALGVNQGFSKALPAEISNTPFWWEGPDGSRVLTWICADSYTDAYTKYGIDPGTARFFGRKEFPEQDPIAVMRSGIGRMIARYRERGYAYDAVLALHGFDNWGSGASRRLPSAARDWNAAGGAPRIVVATPREFFRRIEEKDGGRLPVRRGGFGGQWEPVRTGAPTAMVKARAEEELLRAEAQPDPKRIARLLVYWEHSFGLGVPWPGLMTREQAVLANREQRDLVAGWPSGRPVAPSGEAVALPSPLPGDPFASNGLQRIVVQGGKLTTEPLGRDAWLLGAAERMTDGTLRLRHRLDRRKLPSPAHVQWAWKLTEEEAKAPVELATATSTVTYPRDNLLGYDPGHWIVRSTFQLARTEFRPRGVFVFWRPLDHPGWLLARVVDQALGAEFKGGDRGVLTFEEAYPGEDPELEFSVEVRRP